ncbi:3-hydroxyacyl-CoA dehydrogenase family protein [Sulfitobacter sabulilitoris]|uniref:3-hydroxyacyl-CoA dehydrogenase family protein n=1 Tax=Sulfitobacter sabulilitoris TaxID=2562655 RepID=A0A5S3PD05_9RHOB|nr:3-hydroxyacyl-CoA dehydrogenase family protein [Sulfitobacter sabulilitoris]TMM51737.1 3-hydroxyacyl-CoA dehydrogenase family protein [Sulfitobacter sabulilitoris]
MPSERGSVAIVGGGTMGVGLLYVFAAAGYDMILVEPDTAKAAAAARRLQDAVEIGLARGKLTEAQARAITQGYRRIDAAKALPENAALVVETVPERLELKHAVLADIAARRPRIIATNTSALSIDMLAAAVSDPTTFVGMHFFNPVWSLPLVEIVRGAATSEATLDAARAFAGTIGKSAITVTDTPGFATSRLDLIAAMEAIRMVEAGVASAEDIDRAMVVAYRHPIGPLRLSDIVGLDVRLDIARSLSASLGPRYAPPRLLEEMVERGELGQKTGRGFFDWTEAA